jgi:uncharacterized protein (TIGR03437 family)
LPLLVRSTLLGVFLIAQLPGQTVAYIYDAAGRLTRADYGSAQSIAYTYDASGSLLRREVASPSAFATVSSASGTPGRPVAPDSIVSGYADAGGLAPALEVASNSSSPPTELAGTRVEVTDSKNVTRLAPLFFVSPGQINYVVPTGTALGVARVRVRPASGPEVNGTVEIARAAPALFVLPESGLAKAFFLRVNADGSRVQDLLYDASLAPAAVDLGAENDQVYLLLFGVGIRGRLDSVSATVGGEPTAVLGAAAQGEFAGLDQVNIGPLPRSLAGRGAVDIVLTVGGVQSNTAKVHIR